MENYNSQIKNYLLPFSVKILVAIMLHILISSISYKSKYISNFFNGVILNPNASEDEESHAYKGDPSSGALLRMTPTELSFSILIFQLSTCY